MINIETLKEKLAYYLQKKIEIENGRQDEIEAKVEEYRKSLIEEYAKEDAEDLAKINNYIEVISEIINEDKKIDLQQAE